MSRDTQGWAAMALAGLGAATLVGALLVTGGPMEGRRDRQDQIRLEDLRRLSDQVLCLADSQGGRLPDSIVQTARCPGKLRLADPYGGRDYRYEVIASRSFRLCADFARPLDAARSGNLVSVDALRGCVVTNLPGTRQDVSEAPPAEAVPAP